MTSFKLVTTLTTELFIQCACAFFTSRFVIDRCQIVTDFLQKNCSKFACEPYLIIT